MKRKNSIILIVKLIFNFFKTFFLSIKLFAMTILWKSTKSIPENKFLDVLNFILHSWPKKFWKKPSAVKIWRSISTGINYIFHKEENFTASKNKKK